MKHDVEMRLSKYWFLKPQKKKKDTLDLKKIAKRGANIIDQCQSILALTDDAYTKEQLNLIIRNTTNLMSLVAETPAKESSDHEKKISEACKELQTNALSIPATIHTPTDLPSANYKLALVCMYILLFSLALTIGASFGAWYFGFLTASYFTDYLAVALASIGIPALCVGGFSYGIYSSQKNPMTEQLNNLGKNIDQFCDEITPIEEEDLLLAFN
ncbi:hypothetical protein [Legionella cherrii]|uniref:Uncharacterized protein n=1 Tax=Legionella cherrii TaxID=28084 RepID=A0A0W0SHG5_9GAMM|nr:hypothetical protein [Legionella cherrii]KTC82635.1 hypothetical protein Lche_0315 [Legionella cherrii]VEB35218.1 Uncharacterised protein [Legionella cherrii]